MALIPAQTLVSSIHVRIIRGRMCHTKNDGPDAIHYVTGGPTYRSSHPQAYPSETVFSPLYTGAFTSIMRRGNSNEGERQVLLSQRDTGYSSHYGAGKARHATNIDHY